MIFYAANLRWHGWKLPYTSWLAAGPGQAVTQRSRWKQVRMPIASSGGQIQWQDDKQQIKGTWSADAPPLSACLIDDPRGQLYWNAYQPRARVSLQLPDRAVHGLGYAERLTLTLEPWRLNLLELRWGRYLSDTDRLVWIDLKRKGREDKWVWHQDELIRRATVEDHRVYMPRNELQLDLDRCQVLESEKKFQQVVRNVKRHLPIFPRLFPVSFLQADETKWLSRGVLRRGQERLSRGWAIHEYVDGRMARL